METTIEILDKVKLKNPILIEGLPGIGNVGRVAAGYIASELKMKKFAELYSQHFLPLVILNNDAVAHMLKCEFYYYKGGKNDIIILTGDTQSISPEGHYEVCDKYLEHTFYPLCFKPRQKHLWCFKQYCLDHIIIIL